MKAMDYNPNDQYSYAAFICLLFLKFFEWLGHFKIDSLASLFTIVSCTIMIIAKLPDAIEAVKKIKGRFKK
ncbi:MAG: hypothetical protein QM791_04040 [Ferruginibacter sp.]